MDNPKSPSSGIVIANAQTGQPETTQCKNYILYLIPRVCLKIDASRLICIIMCRLDMHTFIMRLYVLISLCYMVGASSDVDPIDHLCENPDMIGKYMCVMNDGLIQDDRTYNNEYLLAARDPITVFNKTLRPDIAIYSEYTSNTVMSSVTAMAEVYLDYFICSEDTCNNYVDLKYVKNGTTNVSSNVGFMVGVMNGTEFALSTSLRGFQNEVMTETNNTKRKDYVTSVAKAVYLTNKTSDESGYAILDTRVNFEAYFDSLYKKPSFGIANVTINDTCTRVLYPKNAWYQENIMSNFTNCSQATQTFALMGVATNNWCRYCDDSSISVVNNHAPCYPSNIDTCTDFVKYYPSINQTINTWNTRMFNITKNANDDRFYGQGKDTRSWGTLLMEIIAEARHAVPTGCVHENSTSTYQCVLSGSKTCPVLTPYDCVQSDKAINVSTDGYDELSKTLTKTWVTSWQTNTFSMLGYERVSIGSILPQIRAAEKWGYQIAESAVKRPSSPYNPLYSVGGYIVTFALSIAATVGAWFAYTDISKWISAKLNREEHNIIGKLIAGMMTMTMSVLPFIVIVISDYVISESNDPTIIYKQQAFDAPGYGSYKLVVVAKIVESPKRSRLPLEMGIPFTLAVIATGIVAIKFAKFVESEIQHDPESQNIELVKQNAERSG